MAKVLAHMCPKILSRYNEEENADAYPRPTEGSVKLDAEYFVRPVFDRLIETGRFFVLFKRAAVQ